MMRRMCCLAVAVWLVGGAATAQDQIVRQLYGSGVHAYLAGKHRDAHKLLSTAIQLGTDDPRVYYFRGMALIQLGRPEEAGTDFATGARLEAGDADDVYGVNRSLERVQGRARLQIETAREVARGQRLLRKQEVDRARYSDQQRNEPSRTQPPPDDGIFDPFRETAPAPKGSTTTTPENKTPETKTPQPPPKEPLVVDPAPKKPEPMPEQPDPAVKKKDPFAETQPAPKDAEPPIEKLAGPSSFRALGGVFGRIIRQMTPDVPDTGLPLPIGGGGPPPFNPGGNPFNKKPPGGNPFEKKPPGGNPFDKKAPPGGNPFKKQ